MKYLLSASLAFTVCLCLLPLAASLARKANLVDYPSNRKRHALPTPVVGGVVIFISYPTVLQITPSIVHSGSMIAWLALVVLVGLLDDIFELSCLSRIAAHAMIVVGIWFTDGLMVQNIGAIWGGSESVSFPLIAGLLFTAVAVIGAINAVNMIDGLDGLLGSLLFVSLFSLLIIDLSGSYPESSSHVFNAEQISVLLGAL